MALFTPPKEQQTAYQRWEMTSFGDERPSARAAREAEEAAQARLRAAEEAARLEAERRAAELAYELEIGPPPPPPPALPSEAEVAEIREQARLAGYEEGHAAGHADALALGKLETARELEQVRALALAFGDALVHADQLIADQLLELALHLARGMLKTALQVKPELVLPVVRDAVAYLPVLQQPAQLILHPADAALVREAMGEELDKAGWRLVEDGQLERGGCKVDTATNQIDAQAGARWQRLSQALGKDVGWLG